LLKRGSTSFAVYVLWIVHAHGVVDVDAVLVQKVVDVHDRKVRLVVLELKADGLVPNARAQKSGLGVDLRRILESQGA
jgi:hypothetical protein